MAQGALHLTPFFFLLFFLVKTKVQRDEQNPYGLVSVKEHPNFCEKQESHSEELQVHPLRTSGGKNDDEK